MLENLFLLNYLSATGTLFLEILVFFLIIIYFLPLMARGVGDFMDFFKYLNPKNILRIVFIFSLSASILTLIYSELFGVIPCALCWFERVFMYGTVLISGTALFSKKEKKEFEQNIILKYILNFSIIGFIISMYHHVLQITAQSGVMDLPCPASGGDCAKRIIFEYGHVTFPWMAVIIFAFFIILILLNKKLEKNR